MNMLQSLHTLTADLLPLAPGIGLARGRVHEVTGQARLAFALWAAAQVEGAVLWLHPAWAGERLMGDGVRALIDPARLLLARGDGLKDLLWAAEEGLASGSVALVVAELPEVPALTLVRRLHLAAERGAARGVAPVGLLLTGSGAAGGAAAAGVETRWRVEPLPGWADDGRPRWRLARLRARMGPEAAWTVQAGPNGLRLDRIVGELREDGIAGELREDSIVGYPR